MVEIGEKVEAAIREPFEGRDGRRKQFGCQDPRR